MIPHPISRTRNSAPQSVFWPEHGPCFGSPCSAFWNYPSEINALRQNAERGSNQNTNPSVFWNPPLNSNGYARTQNTDFPP